MKFEKINDKTCIYAFCLKDNDIVLGYGKILNDKNNPLEVYVYEKYRSNGYGTKIFLYLIDVLKNAKYKDIILTINKENISMISIINKFRTIHLGTSKNIVKYLLIIS